MKMNPPLDEMRPDESRTGLHALLLRLETLEAARVTTLQAMESLQESSDTYRLLLDESSDPIFMFPVIADLLDTARESVEFLAFSFTSDPLGEAVLRADQAGLAIRGVLDEDQGESNLGTELTMFQAEGLDVLLDGNPGQMHEKVFFVDGEVVVFGSYNFSRNANETNDENVLIIHNRPIAEQFAREFERIYSIATP